MPNMEKLFTAVGLLNLGIRHGLQTVGIVTPTSFVHALGERGYNTSDAKPLLSANLSVGTSIFLAIVSSTLLK